MKPFTIPPDPNPASAPALWFSKTGAGPDPARFVLHTLEPMSGSDAPQLGLRIQANGVPLFGQGKDLVDGGFMLDRESARMLTVALNAWTDPGSPLAVTHEDALSIAHQRQASSNLARCYLAYNEALAYSERCRIAAHERAQALDSELSTAQQEIAALKERMAPAPLAGRGTPYSLYECKLALQKVDAPAMDPYYAELINWLIARVEKLQAPDDQH
jgi:hypothetical protein